MLRLKARAEGTQGKIAVFFVDDNFAINAKRTKSLLRDIIAAGARTFLGRPDQRQPAAGSGTGGSHRGFGRQVDFHRDGVAGSGQPGQREQELQQARRIRRGASNGWRAATSTPSRHSYSVWITTPPEWPSAPWMGCATGRRSCRYSDRLRPFPATPLYDRLASEGRLTRPKHWLEFAPFQMAHTPLRMSAAEVQAEVQQAWENSYSPAANAGAIHSIADEHVRLQDQPSDREDIFPRHLFPAQGAVGLDEGDRAEPGVHYPACQGSFRAI